MKKLPDGWEVVKLGDILKIQTGKKNAQDAVENGAYPFFTRSVDTQRINTYSQDTEALFIAGEGNFAVKYYNGKFDLHQRTYMLTALKDSAIDLKFLQNNIQPKVKKLVSTSVGSTVQSLRKPIIESLKIPLPPLHEQKKIAEILNTVDQKIAFVDNQIEETELLKKGLMQKLLTEGIGHTEFKDSEIGRIPKNWNITLMKDIVQINPDSLTNSTDPNLEIEYIDIASIEQTGKISTTNIFKFFNSPSRARRIVNKNDILLSTVRPYLKSFAIVKEEKDNLVCSTGYAVLRAKQNTYYEYIYQFILTDNFMNQVEKMLVGSNYPAINSNDVKNIKVPFPPLEEQTQIAEILSTTDEKLDTLKAKKESFEELKKGLMQKLLTGEVRV